MGAWTDMAFILVVVLDLFLLASSRLGAAIRAVALQGALLSLLALLLTGSGHSLGHMLVVAGGAFFIKAVLIPWLMFRAIREMAIRREIEPLVGYVPSMILGGVGVVLSFAFSRGLPLPTQRDAPLPRAHGARHGLDRPPARGEPAQGGDPGARASWSSRTGSSSSACCSPTSCR